MKSYAGRTTALGIVLLNTLCAAAPPIKKCDDSIPEEYVNVRDYHHELCRSFKFDIPELECLKDHLNVYLEYRKFPEPEPAEGCKSAIPPNYVEAHDYTRAFCEAHGFNRDDEDRMHCDNVHKRIFSRWYPDPEGDGDFPDEPEESSPLAEEPDICERRKQNMFPSPPGTEDPIDELCKIIETFKRKIDNKLPLYYPDSNLW